MAYFKCQEDCWKTEQFKISLASESTSHANLYLHWKFSGCFSGKDSSGRTKKCMPFSHDMVRTKKSSCYNLLEYLKVIYQKGQPDGNLALPSQQLAHLNSIPSLLYYVIVNYIFTIQMYSSTSVDKYKKYIQ